jgi:hypothetical protein
MVLWGLPNKISRPQIFVGVIVILGTKLCMVFSYHTEEIILSYSPDLLALQKRLCCFIVDITSAILEIIMLPITGI